MMTDHIQRALVTGDLPAFVGGVLHMPGEIAALDFSHLEFREEPTEDEAKQGKKGKLVHVSSPAHKLVVGFDKVPADGEQVAIVPIAAVAPHVPEPTQPQGVPPGTIQSPTGRLMAPQGEDEPGLAREFAPSTADVSDGATAGKAKK